MLVTCPLCQSDFLTESDPYVVMPHSSGYYTYCIGCADYVKDGEAVKRLDIIYKLLSKESNG